MPGIMRRLAAEPLLPFLVGGVLIFAAFDWSRGQAVPAIEVSRELVERLQDDFTALTGREPTAAEVAMLQQRYIDEELLFREALDNGLHLVDPVTRGSLVEAMRYRITGLVPEPDEETLVNYYAEHLERYVAESTVSFEQRYLARKPDSPEAQLAALAAGEQMTWDSFPHGEQFPAYGESMLRGLFGEDFLLGLKEATPGRWIGPVASSFGWHYVRVDSRSGEARLPFTAVRNQVLNDYLQAAIDQAVAARLETLKQAYSIHVEV